MEQVNRARALVVGASWTYGATLASAVAQIFYAAITSRLVDASGYGAYAVSLFAFGLVSLLASGGLGQAIGRSVTLDIYEIRGLVVYALILGSLSALIIFLTAEYWARLWGDPSAAAPIRWLSISAALSPLLGLSTGLLRRLGRFRVLAVCTLVSNLVGMVFGAVAVFEFRSASSLLVSAIFAQALLLLMCLWNSDRYLIGFSSLSAGRRHLGFSWKLSGTSVLSYLTGAITRWGVSRWLGAASLGAWNRAEVLTTIPFQQLQNAVVQVVYPEFRNDIGNPGRARRVWPDLLEMVAWIAVPFSVVVAIAGPLAVPVILGPGWSEAGAVIAPLAIAGGLQIVSTLLSSAIEALGKFGWVVSTQLLLIAVQISAVAATVLSGKLAIAVWALVLTNVVRHAWQLWLCHHEGYIDLKVILLRYLWVGVASTIAGATLWLIISMGISSIEAPWYGSPVLAAVTVISYLLYRFGSLLPPMKIMRAYGILS